MRERPDSYLVIHGDQRVMRREGARGALAVNEQRHGLAVDHVLLDLGDIVTHVVDNVHVQIVGAHLEHLAEGLARQKRQNGPIHPREIRSGCHAAEIILALGRLDGRAGELAIVDLDSVATHDSLHIDKRVRSDLMAQSPASRVDHDHHLSAELDSHFLRSDRIEDLVHDLDLRVVVPCAQRAQLRLSAVLRARGDFGGVRVEHAPVLLAVLLVLAPAVALAQTPVHSQRLDRHRSE